MNVFDTLIARFEIEKNRYDKANVPTASAQWEKAIRWLTEASQVDINLSDEPFAWSVRGLHPMPVACRSNLARSERHRDLLRDEYQKLGLKVEIIPLYAPKIEASLSSGDTTI